jgi:hypothetical protein
MVDLVDCLPVEAVVHLIGDQERAAGDYSAGRFAWRLENPRPFPEPIPVQGRQGFFYFEWNEVLETV